MWLKTCFHFFICLVESGKSRSLLPVKPQFNWNEGEFLWNGILNQLVLTNRRSLDVLRILYVTLMSLFSFFQIPPVVTMLLSSHPVRKHVTRYDHTHTHTQELSGVDCQLLGWGAELEIKLTKLNMLDVSWGDDLFGLELGLRLGLGFMAREIAEVGKLSGLSQRGFVILTTADPDGCWELLVLLSHSGTIAELLAVRNHPPPPQWDRSTASST